MCCVDRNTDARRHQSNYGEREGASHRLPNRQPSHIASPVSEGRAGLTTGSLRPKVTAYGSKVSASHLPINYTKCLRKRIMWFREAPVKRFWGIGSTKNPD